MGLGNVRDPKMTAREEVGTSDSIHKGRNLANKLN